MLVLVLTESRHASGDTEAHSCSAPTQRGGPGHPGVHQLTDSPSKKGKQCHPQIRPLDTHLGWGRPMSSGSFPPSKRGEGSSPKRHTQVCPRNKYPWPGPLVAQWKPTATVFFLSGLVPQHQNPHTNVWDAPTKQPGDPAHVLCKQLPLELRVLTLAWREDQAGL